MKNDDYKGDDPGYDPIRAKNKLPIAPNQKIKPRYPKNQSKKRKIYKILVSPNEQVQTNSGLRSNFQGFSDHRRNGLARKRDDTDLGNSSRWMISIARQFCMSRMVFKSHRDHLHTYRRRLRSVLKVALSLLSFTRLSKSSLKVYA